MVAEPLAQRIDRKLGRILMRFWAVLAFLGAIASIGFGAIVFAKALIPGVLLLLLSLLFFWLGIRAWRDRATLGEILNRDYQKNSKAA